MNKVQPPSPLPAPDYEAIEEAMMETERGRWFLREFARRNRNSDTTVLLDAISKMSANIQEPPKDNVYEKFRLDLREMAGAISKTRDEVSAMRPEDGEDTRFIEATEELDAIVRAAEQATNEILEAAEEIQETAWIMREQGADEQSCDKLDVRATDIYTACSFQDLTGQRISKVVDVLRFLEQRVNAMVDIWDAAADDAGQIAGPSKSEENGARPDSHLLNGPQLEGRGLHQNQVDDMIAAANEALGFVEEGVSHGNDDDLTDEAEQMLDQLAQSTASQTPDLPSVSVAVVEPVESKVVVDSLGDPDDLLGPSGDSGAGRGARIVSAAEFEEPEDLSLSTLGGNGRAALFN